MKFGLNEIGRRLMVKNNIRMTHILDFYLQRLVCLLMTITQEGFGGKKLFRLCLSYLLPGDKSDGCFFLAVENINLILGERCG